MTKSKRQTGYYVTAKHSPDGAGSKTAWLCGPFATFRAADMMVPAISYAARQTDDPRFAFAAYGVSKITNDGTKPLPAGRLDLVAAAKHDAYVGYVITPWPKAKNNA